MTEDRFPPGTLGQQAARPEVGVFRRFVTIKSDFVYLTPDEAEEVARQVMEAAGEARGHRLNNGWTP